MNTEPKIELILCSEHSEYEPCQYCCRHPHYSHDICDDCGLERDPVVLIDLVYDSVRDGD